MATITTATSAVPKSGDSAERRNSSLSTGALAIQLTGHPLGETPPSLATPVLSRLPPIRRSSALGVRPLCFVPCRENRAHPEKGNNVKIKKNRTAQQPEQKDASISKKTGPHVVSDDGRSAVNTNIGRGIPSKPYKSGGYVSPKACRSFSLMTAFPIDGWRLTVAAAEDIFAGVSPATSSEGCDL